VVPTTGFTVGGDWQTSILLTAPDNSVIQVGGGKGAFGISNPYSNFNFLSGPALSTQNPQPGTNALDCLNYDPNYQSANRSKGTFSGRWWFFNGCNVLASTESQSVPGLNNQSFATVEGGYLVADQTVSAKNVNATNIFTSQTSSITIFPGKVGASGSTTYNYWVVGNAAGGGKTLPVATTVTNGNATLNSTNYNQICMPYQSQYSSYDILKGSTATSVALAVVVNGASVPNPQPANYACFDDQGGSTSAYSAPTSNNTGGVIAKGPVVGNGMQNTAITVAGCAQYDASGNESSTGVACGSGGGGSGTVTNVAMTVPGWMNLSGSPITTAGTFALDTVSQPQSYFLASSSGGASNLSPRAIVA